MICPSCWATIGAAGVLCSNHPHLTSWHLWLPGTLYHCLHSNEEGDIVPSLQRTRAQLFERTTAAIKAEKLPPARGLVVLRLEHYAAETGFNAYTEIFAARVVAAALLDQHVVEEQQIRMVLHTFFWRLPYTPPTITPMSREELAAKRTAAAAAECAFDGGEPGLRIIITEVGST